MLKKFFYAVFLTIVLCVSVEAVLRVTEVLTHSKAAEVEARIYYTVGTQIENRWWRSNKGENYFEPPFSQFANIGCQDKARLRKIAEFMTPPPMKSFETEDFLLLPDSLAKKQPFLVRTNRFGFRGPDRDFAKKPGVFRIMVLGAYQTFGWGVDWSQSFAPVLESMLNAIPNTRMRFEVWTFGLPASTTIVGLALFEKYRDLIKPDFVVLDFGHCDTLTRDNIAPGDDESRGVTFPRELLVDGSRVVPKLQYWLNRLHLKSSLLIADLLELFGLDGRAGLLVQDDKTVGYWAACLGELKQQARGVPIVMINQAGIMWWSERHEKAAKEAGIPFYKVQNFFDLEPVSDEERSQFLKEQNWTSVFQSFNGAAAYFKNSEDLHAKYFPNYVNLLQASARGHRLIAKGLSRVILKSLKSATQVKIR